MARLHTAIHMLTKHAERHPQSPEAKDIRSVLDELARLQAIVATLPKDATGKPMVVGQTYHFDNGNGEIMDEVFDYADFLGDTQQTWWPTRKEAEAARAEADKP